ncbi:indole-3-glycerol phosphate synthase TrpC [Hyphomonas jannaschiana]|uniref:Indole-3-glycerol phosphate synthase n=1 Tax=Hyphomonas jannaschiana VP2 TaxID=1280952 RepID=A0A059FB20_9PROT|nr:indole-3-glycerol phosphate synthase TrpC [Hyphomonas jannaschiana]KCZ87751.1 indole-3-glycerol phosphate synthase [Hyphomonas jannaschiana VP2]
MKTALDKIIDYKHSEVAELKRQISFAVMDEKARTASPARGFSSALSRVAADDQNALICELKRKSPSAGEILPGADPVQIATEYEAGGAACLSVLTDGPSFGGSLEDFAAIRAAVAIPMLRKDFMIDPIQVAEARAWGADCILVIMASLEDTLAAELTDCAIGYGMDVLVETHNEAELERALRLPSPLIGVNNRDLKRMVTDLSTTERLAPLIPPDRQIVAESGISTAAHINRLRQTGARRFLIGESLMKRGSERQAAVRELRTTSCN